MSDSLISGQAAVQTPEWVGTLPEDIRTPEALPVLSKYPTQTEAIKGLIEAQKVIGRKGVIMPDLEKGTDEEWSQFHSNFRPAKAEEYGFAKPENLPKGMDFNEKSAQEWMQTFHELGLTKRQAQAIYGKFNETQIKAFETETQASEKIKTESVNALQSEFGKDYQKVISKAAQAAKWVGEDFFQFLDATGLGDSPDIIKALYKFSQSMSEHHFVDSTSSVDGPKQYTKDELMAMVADPRYSDPTRRDPAFVAKVEKAFAEAHPGNR